MIVYKQFEFGKEDKYNYNLYQHQDKEILDLEGKKFGKGKPTGKFENKLVLIGHFSSLAGVLYKMAEMDLENTQIHNMVKKLEDHKIFCQELFKKLSLQIEETTKEESVD